MSANYLTHRLVLVYFKIIMNKWIVCHSIANCEQKTQKLDGVVLLQDFVNDNHCRTHIQDTNMLQIAQKIVLAVF